MDKYIIDVLSDTHSRHNEFKCDGGNVLLHAGDVSGRGSQQEILNFINWFEQQPYNHKIFIPGNHDWDLERNFAYWKDECNRRGITLLNDSGVILKDMFDPSINIKIWGSPVQPWFNSWAFNRARTPQEATNIHGWIKPHWDMIAPDTEILITHGPPHAILDECLRVNGDSYEPKRLVGCEELAKRIKELPVKLHVFGHIHESRGFHYDPETTYVNGSSLDLTYYPVDRKPMRVTREVCQDGSIAYVL